MRLRTAYKKASSNLPVIRQLGELVLIEDDVQKRFNWSQAKIIDLIPGKVKTVK